MSNESLQARHAAGQLSATLASLEPHSDPLDAQNDLVRLEMAATQFRATLEPGSQAHAQLSATVDQWLSRDIPVGRVNVEGWEIDRRRSSIAPDYGDHTSISLYAKGPRRRLSASDHLWQIYDYVEDLDSFVIALGLFGTAPLVFASLVTGLAHHLIWGPLLFSLAITVGFALELLGLTLLYRYRPTAALYATVEPDLVTALDYDDPRLVELVREASRLGSHLMNLPEDVRADMTQRLIDLSTKPAISTEDAELELYRRRHLRK